MRRRENSQSAPSRATVAASGLTANLMTGYLNNPDTPRQIRGVARRMGPNGNGDQEGTTITLEELVPLTHETGERLDEYLASQLVEFLAPSCPS